MIRKIELIYALFEMCYEENCKAYDLIQKAYAEDDDESSIEADYRNGKADGAEEIMQQFGLMDKYMKYCDKRDKGKSHHELLLKAK